MHLFDDWITTVASPGLIAELGRGKDPDDLAHFPLLGDPGGMWGEWFGRFGGVPPKRYAANFDDTETLHRAATTGLGVALARLTLARPLIEAGLLEILSPNRLKSDYAHYLVYPPRSSDHAGLIAFREWLLAQARDYAETLAADVSPPVPRKRAAAKRRAPENSK